jgi:hypothetical protein
MQQRASRLRTSAWEQLVRELVAKGARQHAVEKEIVGQIGRAAGSAL